LSDEDKRKLQVTGGAHGSFTISLPKNWVRDLNLKKGERLFVMREPDGRLSIYPPSLSSFTATRPGSVAAFEVYKAPGKQDDKEEQEMADMLTRKIVSAYLLGYNDIQLKGSLSENVRKTILGFAQRRLLGLTPVTNSHDLMRFKMFGDSGKKLKEVLDDVKNGVLGMLNDALQLLAGNSFNSEIGGFIENAEQTIASYYFFIVRLLKAAVDEPKVRANLGLRHGRDLIGCRLMIKSIERISNHVAKIARLARYVKWPISVYGNHCVLVINNGLKRTIQVFTEALNAHPLLGKSDFECANLAIRDAKREFDEIRALLNPEKKDLFIRDSNMRIIIESVGRTCEYASDIAEIVLNLTMEDLLTAQSKNSAKK
jgi:phosphate uptake regulator